MWQGYGTGKVESAARGAQFESFAKRPITDSIRIRKASYYDSDLPMEAHGEEASCALESPRGLGASAREASSSPVPINFRGEAE